MPTLTQHPLKIPKYLRLAEQFRQQIEGGELRAGDRLPSFPQMRTQFGVTNNTLEKVYDLLERDGLIVRQPSRGTFVAERKAPERNGNAAPAAKSRYATLGVSGLGFTFAGSSTYWSRILQGMREAAERDNAQLMLLDHNSLTGWEKADGVLLCDYVSDEVLHTLPESMPHIALVTPLPGMSAVIADDYRGGRLATEHLLTLGHRRIAYLHGGQSTPLARREAGYLDALKAAGVELKAEWMHPLMQPREYYMNYGSQFVRSGHESMKAWLENAFRKLRCTAILAHNDEVAVGVIEALREVGLSVPKDISVVGYDGTEISEYSSPRLTTIEVPLREIGNAAAQLLLESLSNSESRTERHILPVQLRERQSTAAPPQ